MGNFFGDLGRAVGSALGSVQGAVTGGTAGFVVGSVLPGVGNVLGALTGGAVGGNIGANLGSSLGGAVGDQLDQLLTGGRPNLGRAVHGSGSPNASGDIFATLARNFGKILDASGDTAANGIRGLGEIRDAMLRGVVGGVEGVGQIRDAIFDRMEGAIRDFGRGGLPFLGQPAQPWPFPHIQPPRQPFVPIGDCMCRTPENDLSTLRTPNPNYSNGIGGFPGDIRHALNDRDSAAVVQSGRYDIHANEDGVKVFDRQTNTWVKMSDEMLMRTSDGDRANFDGNVTMRLEDGTKLTFQVGSDGKLDNLGVFKGDEAVVISGFSDGRQGIHVGNERTGFGAAITDMQMADGTKLFAGHQVDDLSIGSPPPHLHLPNPGWGDRPIRPVEPRPSPGVGGPGGSGGVGNDFGFEPGDTVIDKLFKILSKLQEKLEGSGGAIDQLSQVKEGDQTGLQKAMFEIQKLQNLMKQVFETITNIQKSNDDMKEAIIRNFA